MFEKLTSKEDRGQVGIGTLIIFIALVLVAAVAAGVLVNTSGELQSRASDTGDDAQAQVSNQIDVVSATGEINSAGNGNVSTVTLVVKKSPGSDPIDLKDATIEYTSNSNSQTLTEGALSSTKFSTNEIKGNGDVVLDDTDERVEITIDTSSIESGNGVPPGGNVELQIVDQSGASTVYGVNVPDVLTGTYVEV
jgi:flagellin-like protein